MAVTASATPGNAADRTARLWPAAALVALTVILGFESLRLLLPHLYGLKERSGLITVLIAFLAVAVSPFLAPVLGRVLQPRRAVLVGALLLGAWRLVAQFLHPVDLAVAIAGAVVALIALTLVLTAPVPGGGRGRAVGLLGGLAADVMLLGAFITWEPAWQDGVAARAVGAVLGLLLPLFAYLVFREMRPGAGDQGAPGFAGGVAVGALVALEFMFLANGAYLAAASGLGLGWAMLVVVAAAVGALLLVALVPGGGRVAAAVGAVVLTAAGFVLPWAAGPTALVLLIAAQLGAGLVAARALAGSGRGPVRAGVGLALGWFAGLVAILLYQLHYDRPLPVDNRYVTTLLGLLALLALVGRPALGVPPARRGVLRAAGALAVAGLLAGGLVASMAPDFAAQSPDGGLRVVQWNVRQTIDEDGRLDPERVAAVVEAASIEAEGKTVVVLNEVARGWPLSGQLDLATWMSYRLGMNLAWGAAAGPQFGNLVLSRFAVTDTEVVALSHWDGYQGRSLLDATLDLGGGRSVTVLATHLQHRNTDDSHAVRMTEISEILEYWAGEASTVLVGDLNPKQGDPPEYPPRVPGEFEEIARLLAAGFTTAANLEACDPPTSNENCSDYILAGPGLVQITYLVGDGFGDHRMLLADVAAE